MTNKRAGMVTEIDQAVMDWLETHHIRAKDVRSWSGCGTARRGDLADLTQLTITLYVSGVDDIPPASGDMVKPTGLAWVVGERGPETEDAPRCFGCGHPRARHQDGKCSGDYLSCSCTEVFPASVS
jgi:hypothetical protein